MLLILRMAACLFFYSPLIAFNLQQAAEEIVEAGAFLNHFGLCPATSGNFSIRLDEQFIAVTASGKHKGFLSLEDILIVNLEGVPQNTLKKP